MRQTYCLEDTVATYINCSAQMNIKYSEQNSQSNPYLSFSLTLLLELLDFTIVKTLYSTRIHVTKDASAPTTFFAADFAY